MLEVFYYFNKSRKVNHSNIKLILGFYYGYNLILAFNIYHKLAVAERFHKPPTDPLWLLAWLPDKFFFASKVIIGLAYLILSFICLIKPYKLIKLGLALSALFTIALLQSYGKISHQYHVHLFILLALPVLFNNHQSPAIRMDLTMLQGLILVTYSLSGLWKYYTGIAQWILGQPHLFSPSAMASKVLFEEFTYSQPIALGGFITEFPIIASMGLWAVVYLETTSFSILFKPQWHKVWGMSLILFHLLSYFSLGVLFTSPISYLTLFFVLIPVEKSSGKKLSIFELPWLGPLFLIIKTGLKKTSSIDIYNYKEPFEEFKREKPVGSRKVLPQTKPLSFSSFFRRNILISVKNKKKESNYRASEAAIIYKIIHCKSWGYLLLFCMPPISLDIFFTFVFSILRILSSWEPTKTTH